MQRQRRKCLYVLQYVMLSREATAQQNVIQHVVLLGFYGDVSGDVLWGVQLLQTEEKPCSSVHPLLGT